MEGVIFLENEDWESDLELRIGEFEIMCMFGRRESEMGLLI